MKYKYSRKELAERLYDSVNGDIGADIKDLLATLSPEEESQKIMMEQVPKEKSWICACGQKNSSWAEQCGRCEKSRFIKSSKEKEWKGILNTDCPYGNPDCPICSTPTPSTNIKEIELPKKLITVDNCAGLTQFTFEQEFKDWIKQVTNSLNTIIKK